MNGLSISLGVVLLVAISFGLGYMIGHAQGVAETWTRIKGYTPPAAVSRRKQ